jgi:sortase A
MPKLEVPMRKILVLILIFIGLALIFYPSLRDHYYESQQQKITSHWLAELEHPDQSPSSTDVPPKSPPSSLDLSEGMEGLLIIEKINLKVPIFTGLSDRNLNLGIASIAGKPGEVGNYVLAGHNSHTYGLLFNRLHELSAGDKIKIQDRKTTYVYRVTDRFITSPDNIQALKPRGQKKEITLVTCDYSRQKPYLRLIVKGEFEV